MGFQYFKLQNFDHKIWKLLKFNVYFRYVAFYNNTENAYEY